MVDEQVVGSVWNVPRARVFISYSHKDNAYRDELVAHLASLEKTGVMDTWHDRKITPGQDWSDAIDDNLARSDVIVVLASADFLASDYCSGIELERALARNSSKRSVLVPVIVRPCTLSASPLAKLEALPNKAKPISEWKNRDRAWVEVIEGILKVVALVKGQREGFLEKLVPAILIKAYTRRAHLVDLELDIEIRPDGMYVHPRSEPVKCHTIIRNIQRLESKHPKIYRRIVAFCNMLRESLEQARREIWKLYDMLFEMRGLHEFVLNVGFEKPLEVIVELLNEEAEIEIELSEAGLKSSLFGLQSVEDSMADLKAALEVINDNVSKMDSEMTQLKDIIVELKKIGKRSVSDEFEEPKKH